MSLFDLTLKNLFNFPLLSFVAGILIAFITPGAKFPSRWNQGIIIYILFCIGIKGGGPLVEYMHSTGFLLLPLTAALIMWGLLQPIFSFYLLKIFTSIDKMTAAAIAASFGSISVITFITTISFLEHLQVSYQKSIIVILTVMEIPAILSGIFIARLAEKNGPYSFLKFLRLFREVVLNKAILAIIAGLLVGGVLQIQHWSFINEKIIFAFTPSLCLFLFELGLQVGCHRQQFQSFSLSLSLFGLYMPVIGAIFGLLLSYLIGLDKGTATLIAVLTASASYIAVPAVMRIMLPQAKEAIYLPLALGIAFPFNIIFGIPLYYQTAHYFLG